MCKGARCLRSPRGVIDVNVIRGDILPNDLHMACLDIPGPAGMVAFYAHYSVVSHILTMCEAPCLVFQGLKNG